MIREYEVTDKNILLGLINELQDFGVSIDPMKRARRGEKYGEIKLAKTLENVEKQSGKIYLACNDANQQVIGFIMGFVLIQDEEKLQEVISTKTGYVNRLYMRESYREKSVGTQLMITIESYFKSIGCEGIWIETDAHNTHALEFYKKRGFLPREIHLLKRL